MVAPDGTLIARTPENEVENQMLEVPFDQPASAAFLGDRVLVTNHALFSRNPNSYAVLDVFADEPGLPLFRPVIPGPAANPGQPPRPHKRRKCKKRKRGKLAAPAAKRCKRKRRHELVGLRSLVNIG